MPEVRKKQMNSAIKYSIIFLTIYSLITQQVLANGWLRRLDEWIFERDILLVSPDSTPLIIILPAARKIFQSSIGESGQGLTK
jgi:hypothetical protein